MSQRISAILLVALVISAAATYGVYRLIASRTSGTARGATPVVEAARTLEVGTLIKDSDLKMGVWAGTVPGGMATKKDGLIGRGVIADIYAGEPVMESRLAAMGAGAGLAAIIPPGMRACAVKVNEIVGVAGFVMPGMRVDVVIAGIPPGSSNAAGPQSRMLLQNIQVLSAGQNYKTDAEGKPVVVPVVNLLVTPQQAEVLSLVNDNNQARIQLVLRNPLDTREVHSPGTALATLFGGAEAKPNPVGAKVVHAVVRKSRPAPPKAAAPAAPPPTLLIEVINGGKQTEAKFARAAEEKQ